MLLKMEKMFLSWFCNQIKMPNKLSVVLATKNEEGNIGACLESVKGIADEVIVFDEHSTDKTKEIAEKHGAKVFNYHHITNFHETKQKAIDRAVGDWILQLDADERVTTELAKEIKSVIEERHSDNLEKIGYSFISESIPKQVRNDKEKLFNRHQSLIARREGRIGKKTGEVVAFFIPRKNIFLGKPLIHGGVYPDGVIRLFKRGKARLPGKSVHELMEIDGEVGWLYNDLEHHDSPTFQRYFDRLNRYTDLIAKDFRKDKLPANLLYLLHYSFSKPLIEFVKLYLRHKGILDGMQGFIWSLFSSLRFPLAYFKYWQTIKK